MQRSSRSFILTAALVTAMGCPEPVISVHNADPRAVITSHADGAQPDAGYLVFSGSVEDADHTVDQLEVSWLYEGAEACPPLAPDANGNTTCEIFLEAGDHTVTLQAEDPLGGLGPVDHIGEAQVAGAVLTRAVEHAARHRQGRDALGARQVLR